MYRIDRLYRHLEFSLALPLIVTKLTRIATYSFYLIHWVGVGGVGGLEAELCLARRDMCYLSAALKFHMGICTLRMSSHTYLLQLS